MEHSTEILYNNTQVYCSKEDRFGTDAILLARFCRPKVNQRAVDLCSGCGIVSLEWHDSGHRGPCLAVELRREASDLLREAVLDQQLLHIQALCSDLRSLHPLCAEYDICACNPPYFCGGQVSPSAARAAARHDADCSLEDVCSCAFRLLKDGGRFSMCFRPERLAEALELLRRHRLEPKRLAFVKNQPGQKPWLFLVEAQKNRRTGLIVEPDIIITAGAALYGPKIN